MAPPVLADLQRSRRSLSEPAPVVVGHYAGIQAWRGLAALAVLATHLFLVEGKYLGGHWIPERVGAHGYLGVDLFFVISGFIMVTISGHPDQPLRAAGAFLWRRCLRIYPTYWVFTLAALSVWLVKPEWVNRASGHRVDWLGSLTLWPGPIVPVLNQCWTLSYEMYFYCMFALLIGANARQRLPQWLALWSLTLLGLHALTRGSDLSPLGRMVTNPLALEFIAGCGIALLASRLGMASSAMVTALGGMLLIAGFWWNRAADWAHLEQGRVIHYGLPCALMVLGTVRLEQLGRLRVPSWLHRLGNASYSIYLSHVLVLTASARLWSGLASQWAGSAMATFSCALAAIAVGMLSHVMIERPLSRRLRARASTHD